ncbi:MAG: efflux RND transporter periplasmic adaptor subunit [Verrucomicrobia bacterium]|nr:efflux RND transporter periplasmic adaptor subunit [Verrucomicrobiota bacterium]
MNPHHDSHTSPPPPQRRYRLGRIGLVAAVLIVAAFVAGLLPRLRARQLATTETRELATPTVTVVSPAPGRAGAAIALPAEVKAFVEAPIYARASGYLKRWLVDIGAHVEPGQLLAEIDTPELDQDLARARAELARADAGLALAKTTSARWTELLKTASVSEQETAEKKADLALKAAAVEAERANVHRLENMKSFARVIAPFDGTITARKTDIGQLITAAGSHELFRLAQTRTLRVFVSVPQTLAHAITLDQRAEVTFPELPGRKFQAKVVRTAGAVDADSRTLLTELSLDNARGEFLSGSYAQVRFTEARSTAALTLPSNALLFRAEGMQVGLVGPDNKVSLRSIKLGRDFGKSVEVIEGIGPTDRVILNPSDSLTAGATVRVAGPSQTVSTR